MSKHYTCVLSAQHGVFCATLGPFITCENFLPLVVHHSIPLVMLDFNFAQFHRFCLDSETIANEKHLNLPFSHWKLEILAGEISGNLEIPRKLSSFSSTPVLSKVSVPELESL